MKNKLYLIITHLIRKKGNIFNIIFISCAMFLILIISSYGSSAHNYMEKGIYESIYYRTAEVWLSDNDFTNSKMSLEDIKNELSSIDHVANVSRFVSFRNMLHANELQTKKLDGYIELYSANNDTLPKIVTGSSFPNKNGYYMICPENFYSTSNLDELKYYPKKNKIQNILNKDITFDYKSNYGKYDYKLKLNVIGLYENSKNYKDENKCYVTENILMEIAKNQYADDIDKETNKSNLDLQNSFVIEVDNLTNMNNVKDAVESKGFIYDPMASISTQYFNDINNNVRYFTIIILIIVFFLILFIFQKRFKEDKNQYQLMALLGYNQKDIKFIYLVSNIINLIISIFLAIIFSMLLIFAFKIIIKSFPFIFNKWEFTINYSSMIFLIAIILIANIISSLYNVRNLFKDTL